MEAVDIPAALIEPSAGRINQAGRIQLMQQPCDPFGVKLSPALIKGNPGDNTRVIVQGFYHLAEVIYVFLSALMVGTGKQMPVGILHRNPHPAQQGGQVGHKPVPVIRATIWHILPYQHSQPVAVEIPAVSLDLAMLSQHIKAKILHGTGCHGGKRHHQEQYKDHPASSPDPGRLSGNKVCCSGKTAVFPLCPSGHRIFAGRNR